MGEMRLSMDSRGESILWCGKQFRARWIRTGLASSASLFVTESLLTQDDIDYGLTEKLLGLSGLQDNYEAIFGLAFCNYRPALEAFIQVTSGEKEKFIRVFARELGYALTTSVLETMDVEQIKSLMDSIVLQMKSKAS